jgi:hypothetical protein
MSNSKNKSIIKLIFQSIEDFFIIIKNEIEVAKKTLTYSAKKLGFGIGYLITAFLLLNISLLFLLIALAYGFIQLGIPGWISFLLVAAVMIALALILVLLANRSFRKMKGIGESARIASETKKYLSENVKPISKESNWNSLD